MPTTRQSGRRRAEKALGIHPDGLHSSDTLGASAGASGHEKSPGFVRGGDYLNRRAVLNRTASGSSRINRTGTRSPPMLLYHMWAGLSRIFFGMCCEFERRPAEEQQRHACEVGEPN